MDTLSKLCAVLSSEPLTQDDIASALQSTEEKKDSAGNWNLTPADPDFAKAVVVESANEPGTTAYVTLTVAEDRDVTVGALKEAFGDYRELPRMHPGNLPKIIFYPEQPGKPHSCAVIVDVSASEGDLATGLAKTVTLRRDIRE